jgi:hypothetical protein
LNPFVRNLEVAADRVAAWGEARVSDGLSLRDALTVDGVSFWDVMAVDLALYRVPHIDNARLGTAFRQLIRAIVAPLRFRRLADFRRVGSTAATRPGRLAPVRVMLLGFSPYMTRDILAPVAASLARMNIPAIILGPRQPEHEATSGAGYVSWTDFWTPASKKDAASIARALDEKLHYVRALTNNTDAFRVPNAVKRETARRIWNAFADARYLLAPHLAVAKNALNTLQPQVILSPDVADPRTRLYALLARERGIPVLEIQLGSFGEEATEWRFFRSSAVAAWGERSKRVLAAHGVPETKIFVTGSPRHDKLRNGSDLGEKLRRRFNVGETCRLVVLASVYSLVAYQTEEELEALRAMKRDTFALASKQRDLLLVVKPHPLEDIAETRALAGQAENVVVLDPRDDIRELILACDALLTFGSTVTLDALILGKATVSLAYSGWDWGEAFVEGDATEVCRTPAEIEGVLSEIARDAGAALRARHEKARDEFVQDCVGNANAIGEASDRIAALAVKLAEAGATIEPNAPAPANG